MSSFTLSQQAERQLRNIQLYAVENFGDRQAKRYLKDLARCFELLSTQPRMGRLATKLGPAVRRHEHASHVVFYEIVKDGILVLAVVHQRNLSELEI